MQQSKFFQIKVTNLDQITTQMGKGQITNTNLQHIKHEHYKINII